MEKLKPVARYRGPLGLAGVTVEAYVLDDGRRVLSLRGAVEAITGTSHGNLERAIRPVLEHGTKSEVLAPISRDSKRISMGQNPAMSAPIRRESKRISMAQNPPSRPLSIAPVEFAIPTAPDGRGITAEQFADILTAYTMALVAGRLRTKRQMEIAGRCAMISGASARLGLVGLIDEATGYQKERSSNALQQLLDLYVGELKPWAARFPEEFWKQLFRLRRWSFPLDHERGAPRGPRLVGHVINDIVYRRLPPGVLEELQRRNPASRTGQRRHKHHQFLTTPAEKHLERHVQSLVTLMSGAPDYGSFIRALNRAMPVPGETIPLPIPEQ